MNLLVHTFTSSGTVTLGCDNPDTAPLFVTNGVITATPGGAISSSALPWRGALGAGGPGNRSWPPPGLLIPLGLGDRPARPGGPRRTSAAVTPTDEDRLDDELGLKPSVVATVPAVSELSGIGDRDSRRLVEP